MSSKPTPLPRFLPLESFFMRLASSSSLLLASLALSSSSRSALAAPAGDGPESLSSPAPVPPHASIPHDSNDTMAQPNGYLQATNLVDGVAALLSPELGKAIPDILRGILDLNTGEDAPKAREASPDVVKYLVSPGKTLRAEIVADDDVGGASEDSSEQPTASQEGASAPPAAGGQGATSDVAPDPPDDCPSQPSPRSGPVVRQAPSSGKSEDNSAPLSPDPPTPPPPVPSGPGANAGGSGANVGASSGGDAGVSAGEDVGCIG